MSAARKFKTTPVRKGLIAKIKIAQKQLGLDDDTYRDMLAGRYDGKTSAKQLTIQELEDFVRQLKVDGAKFTKAKKKAPPRAGKRPLADGEQNAKMRALWITLYHLGVVREPSEQALVNFVKRLTKVPALQWLDIEQSNNVIEALKAMATRESGVNWQPYYPMPRTPVHRPRHRVLEAQWRIYIDVLPCGHNGETLAERVKALGVNFPPDDEQLDRAIENLGTQIRKSLTEQGCQTLKEWKETKRHGTNSDDA